MNSCFPIASAVLVSTLSIPAPEGPFRELSFEAAQKLAEQEDKVVFIDFFTTWCAPCKKLDRTTWVDQGVVTWLGKHTVPIKLDAEIETVLAKHYRVDAYPTLLFVDAEGAERGRIVGYRNPEQFLAQAPVRLAGTTALQEAEAKLVGHEDDISLRQARGDELARAGRHEEALVDYLFCFDEGRDWPGYTGVRVSFLLASIVRLGATHPPALAALRERADVAGRRLLEGTPNFPDAQDLAALNRSLERAGETLKIYDVLRTRAGVSTNVLNKLFDAVIDELLKAERYEDVIDGAGDPLRKVDAEIARFQMIQGQFEGGDPKLSPVEYMRRSAVTDSVRFYEALLGADYPDAAGLLADKLIAFDPSGATFAVLASTAGRFNQFAAARAILERGFEAVPEEQRLELERANRKLPEAERYERG